MPVAMKFGVGRQHDGRKLFMNVMEPEDGKKGFGLWINEISDGSRLPGYKAQLFLNGDTPGRQWFEISGPIKALNPDGTDKIEARRHPETGDFLNEKGETVDSEEKAAKQFSYIRDNQDNLVLGKLGTINVINTKKEKETGLEVPTKSTYLGVKLYSPQESLDMARTLYAYQNSEGDKKEELMAALNEQQKQFGEWTNMFINEGAEYLGNLGFEVRVPDSPANTPAA